MNRVVGTFTCECGYSYGLYSDTIRLERAPAARFVVSRGSDCDDALRIAWNDPTIGNYALRLKFKLKWKDLNVEAEMLGFKTPRQGMHPHLTERSQDNPPT